jgi:hypothetical protein
VMLTPKDPFPVWGLSNESTVRTLILKYTKKQCFISQWYS